MNLHPLYKCPLCKTQHGEPTEQIQGEALCQNCLKTAPPGFQAKNWVERDGLPDKSSPEPKPEEAPLEIDLDSTSRPPDA
jgi:hypothetical protein